MSKLCPLMPGGTCDFPELLAEFPSHVQSCCAEGGKCLLREVQIPGTNDGQGPPMNLVQMFQYSQYRFGGSSVESPFPTMRDSIRQYMEARE